MAYVVRNKISDGGLETSQLNRREAAEFRCTKTRVRACCGFSALTEACSLSEKDNIGAFATRARAYRSTFLVVSLQFSMFPRVLTESSDPNSKAHSKQTPRGLVVAAILPVWDPKLCTPSPKNPKSPESLNPNTLT